MAESLKPLAGLIILVVEDSGELLLGLKTALLRAGAVHVELCASATKAQERLASPPYPDIVLIDLHLAHGERGTDLANWMATQRSLPTKRVSFSGARPEEVLLDAVDHAYHAILTKPIAMATVATRIAGLV